MFACLGELPTKGLPLVAEIPHKAFAALRSIRDMPQVDHATHLGGISSSNWQMKLCKRAKYGGHRLY